MVTKTADILFGKWIQVHFSSSHKCIMNSKAPSLIMKAQEKDGQKVITGEAENANAE
jgi:hypothetical protein